MSGASLFSWINYCDSAPIFKLVPGTGGTYQPGMPVENLRIPSPQIGFRSLAGSPDIEVDFGSDVSIGVMGIFGTTINGSDTCRFRLATSAQAIGGTYDAYTEAATANGVVSGYNQVVRVLATPVTARYFRFTAVTSANSEIGRIWAGPVWNPDANLDYGWGDQWLDQSAVTRAQRTSTVFRAWGQTFRRVTAPFNLLSEADRAQAMEMERVAGLSAQALFIPDTGGDLARLPILGRFSTVTPIVQPDDRATAVYTRTFTIDQDL